jgi:hypothetical protein
MSSFGLIEVESRVVLIKNWEEGLVEWLKGKGDHLVSLRP